MSLHVHKILPAVIPPPRHFHLEAKQVIAVAIIALLGLVAFAFRKGVFKSDFTGDSRENPCDSPHKGGSNLPPPPADPPKDSSPPPPADLPETGEGRPPELEENWEEMLPPPSSSSAAADEGLPVIEISPEELSGLGRGEQQLFLYASIIRQALDAENYWLALEYCGEFDNLHPKVNCQKFLTDQFTIVKQYQKRALSFYAKQYGFVPQMARNDAQIDEKRDGNCGWSSWVRILNMYFSDEAAKTLEHYQAVCRNLDQILGAEGEGDRFLREVLDFEDTAGRGRLRGLVATYLEQRKANIDIQFFLDATIKADLVADLKLIMFEVASQAVKAYRDTHRKESEEATDLAMLGKEEEIAKEFYSTHSEVDNEEIQRVLDRYPHKLYPFTVENILEFYLRNPDFVDAQPHDQEETVEMQLMAGEHQERLRDAYVQKIQQDKIWMQNLEMLIMSEIFRFKVCIVREDKLAPETSDAIYDLLEQGKSTELFARKNAMGEPNLLYQQYNNGKLTSFHETTADFFQWVLINHCDNGSHFEFVVPRAHIVDKAEE